MAEELILLGALSNGSPNVRAGVRCEFASLKGEGEQKASVHMHQDEKERADCLWSWHKAVFA